MNPRFLIFSLLSSIAAVGVVSCRPLGETPSPPPDRTPNSPTPATPTVQIEVTSTPEPTSYLPKLATPLEVNLPTPVPSPVTDWRPPPYPAPWAIRPEDHFFIARPIPSGEVNWPHPRFRYGNTHFGDQPVHTGVDLGADRSAPVMAAGSGEVVWVGYGLYRGTFDENDPYGLAIAIRHDFGYANQTLFTVYAHMEEVYVWDGQRVEMGEVIGAVGSTGHADGPHLHFEVRLGENRYFNTYNPELWMTPPEGWAVLAGRVEDSWGRPLQEQLVQIRSIETAQRWDVWTYVNRTIHPDAFYQENFVISDLPAGPYEIQVDFVGKAYVAQLLLHPGQTNFIIFGGRNGYIIEPTPTPPDLSSPPE